MSAEVPGGTSFMEDYTYDFGQPAKVLGTHMLEVCPSIADGKSSLEIYPLAIGGKEDPIRLVFTARSGPAVVASVVDLGNRFRMVANKVDVVAPDEPMPKAPEARAVWVPRPSLKVASTAWLYAGGSHHTAFSQALTVQHLADFAEIAGVEFLKIDGEPQAGEFKRELTWNDAYYSLKLR